MSDPDVLMLMVAERAITELLLQYCDAVDAAEVDEIVDLFEGTATLDRGNGNVLNGADELRQHFRRGAVKYSATSHSVSNVQIKVEADRAVVRSYLYAWHRRSDDGSQVEVWARYDDDIVRTSVGWRFAHRALRVFGEAGASFEFERPWRRTM